jgi:hypothetical protein
VSTLEIIELVVGVLLVGVAGWVAFFVTRATVALVRIERNLEARQVVFDKQTKALLRKIAKTEGTANRILGRTYEFQRQVDVLLMDPKVQAALNRHEGV